MKKCKFAPFFVYKIYLAWMETCLFIYLFDLFLFYFTLLYELLNQNHCFKIGICLDTCQVDKLL